MSKEICILNGTKWILGGESTEPMNWEDANNWCKSIGQDLPPREVLLMAFLNPEIRSKFANTYYWSSSEFDSYSAWDQDFNIGDQNVNFSKSAKLSVRAVRAIIAEASEQTEQEPVAWMWEEEGDEGCVETMIDINKPRVNMYRENIRPLDIAPPVKSEHIEDKLAMFAPVGYLYKQMDCYGEWATIFKVDKPYIKRHDIKDIVPLYTAPPKRKFLSVKQAKDLWETTFKSAVPYYTFYEICVAIEQYHGTGGGE